MLGSVCTAPATASFTRWNLRGEAHAAGCRHHRSHHPPAGWVLVDINFLLKIKMLKPVLNWTFRWRTGLGSYGASTHCSHQTSELLTHTSDLPLWCFDSLETYEMSSPGFSSSHVLNLQRAGQNPNKHFSPGVSENSGSPVKLQTIYCAVSTSELICSGQVTGLLAELRRVGSYCSLNSPPVWYRKRNSEAESRKLTL